MNLAERYLSADSAELARVCSEECGARCCRGRVLVDFQDELEAERVQRLAASLGKKLKLCLDEASPYMLLSDREEGRCRFLGDNNLCTVYDRRPNGCRNYPSEPLIHGCRLSGWEP